MPLAFRVRENFEHKVMWPNFYFKRITVVAVTR